MRLKNLLLILSLGLIVVGNAHAQAMFRPCDKEGDCLDINSDGTVTTTGGGGQGEDPDVIFNVKAEYGAMGDGIILLDGNITSADATFTSATATFTSADVGKVITITGAAGTNIDLTTTISSINSATSVELAATASATVTNVSFCYGTDDTVAIQAAINAVGALTIKYGTVFFPAGIYIVNGAYTATNNSQLAIPTISTTDTTATMGSIELKGVVPFKATSFVNLNTGGSMIYSTRNGASGADSILSGKALGSSNNFTLMEVHIENLSFKTVQNPANTALNLEFITGATGRHILIDSGLNISDNIPLPTTTTSYGLITPGGQNNATNEWEELRIRGFYNGIKVAEHFNLKGGYVLYTVYGLRLQAMSHSSQIDYISIERTNNMVKCDGAHSINIDMLDIEHNGTGWTPPVDDIVDTSGVCTGSIGYFVTGVGGASNTFTVDGPTEISYFGLNATRKFEWNGITPFLRLTDTNASGSSSGGNFMAVVDDDAATASGDRLGGLLFGGTGNSSQDKVNGAEISGFAEQAFTTSVAGTQIRLYTASIGTETKTQKMVLTADGNLGLGTSAPDKKLEINLGTNDAFRLSYNDANGSATNYSDMTVSSAGNLNIEPSGGAVITSGTFTSTKTTDLGWSLATGANTACNTTCTSACVLGWDTSVTEVAVICTDATADKCLCAGPN